MRASRFFFYLLIVINAFNSTLFFNYPAWGQDKEVQVEETKPEEAKTEEPYQQGEEEFLWGDGKITSVAKRPQTIGEVANSISIITRQDIVASGATTLPDLFAFVPGVQLFYRNYNEPEVIVRGMPKQYSPRLLVLVDGVTIYTPFTSGVFWFSVPVTVDSIERIEIIRGPASVVYGANAFSGVINIITRKPDDFQGVEAKSWAGNLGNYGASVTTTLPVHGNNYFRFSGEYFQSNGFGADNGDGQDDSAKTGTIMADGFINFNDKSSLRLGTWYRRTNNNLPANNIAPAALSGEDNLYALAQFDTSIVKNHQLKVYTFFNQDNISDRGNSPLFIYQNNLIKFDFQVEDTWNFKDKNYLMVGTNYRYNGVKDAVLITESLGNRQTLNMASLYFNDEYKILKNLILTGGARYDYDGFSGNNWSARLNLSWLPHPDHILRASISRGVRSINYFEEIENVAFPLGPFNVEAKGNPGLAPETIVSSEFGYIGNFLNNNLRFNFDFFYNNVNNLILPTLTPLPPANIAITVDDLGDTNLVGFEYGIKYHIFDWWDFTFDHSFVHQNNAVSGRAPNNMINVGNRFKTKFGFSANIAFNWTQNYTVFDVGAIASRDIGNLYRLDVRLAQSFLHDKLELAFVGQGLLDYPRVEFEDTLRADRRLYGTLTYRFKK